MANQRRMHEVIVLIGAGSAAFTRGLVADLVGTGWSAELRLVDPDPEALAVADGLARAMVSAAGAPISIAASTDRRSQLPGATAVIMTVGVGGRRAWEQDVFVPRRYGIYQPVGDTVGPGGTSRGLRMAPVMVDIAREVVDLAPDALFINYSNPMAICCRAIRKATGAPVIGLCHGVHHVADYLAGLLGVPRPALRYEAGGVNHLTWFTQVSTEGKDRLPDLQRAGVERTDQRFSWELFQRFGAFPAVLDRHVVEFFPQFFRHGAYYGRTLGVDAFSFEETIAGGDEGFEAMKALATGQRTADLEASGGEHEQVMSIIGSIRSGDGRIYSANLPNDGQLPGAPPCVIVETPATATTVGLSPTAVHLTPAVLGTLMNRFAWAEVTVDAALSGNRDLVVQALAIDGCVESLAQAATLADDLLSAQAAWLPNFAAVP